MKEIVYGIIPKTDTLDQRLIRDEISRLRGDIETLEHKQVLLEKLSMIRQNLEAFLQPPAINITFFLKYEGLGQKTHQIIEDYRQLRTAANAHRLSLPLLSLMPTFPAPLYVRTRSIMLVSILN